MAEFENNVSDKDEVPPLNLPLPDDSTHKPPKKSPTMRRHFSEPINLANLSLTKLGLIDERKDEEEGDAPKLDIDAVKQYMQQNPVQCAAELETMTQKITDQSELNVSKTVIDQLLNVMNFWIQHHGIKAIGKQREYAEKCNILTLDHDKQRSTLQQTIQEYKNECAEHQQQRKVLDTRNKELTTKLNDRMQQLKRVTFLMEQNERLLDDVETKSTENERHKKTILEQQKTMNQLETEKNRFAKMVETQNSNLSQMALMENELKKRTNEINDANKQYKAMEAQLERIKADKDELFKEKALIHDELINYGKLKDNLSQSEENERELKQKIVVLTKRNNDANNEINVARKQRTLVQTECDEQKRQRAALETAKEELVEKLNAATQENVLLKEENAALTEDIERQSTENETNLMEIVSQEQMMKQLETEKMEVETLVEAQKSKLLRMAALENERKEMETQLERVKMAKTQSEEKEKELKEEIAVLNERNNDLNNEIDALNHVIESYDNSNATGQAAETAVDDQPTAVFEEGSFVEFTLGRNEGEKEARERNAEFTWQRTLYRSFVIVGLGCACYLGYRQLYGTDSREKGNGIRYRYAKKQSDI